MFSGALGADASTIWNYNGDQVSLSVIGEATDFLVVLSQDMAHAVFWERDASNAYSRLVGQRLELLPGNDRLTKVPLEEGASDPWIGVAPITPPVTPGVWLQYFHADGRPQHAMGVAQAVTQPPNPTPT